MLRIIGGRWRGRKIAFPPVEAIRPTPDRIRETLFNWLQPVLGDCRCLDLYAGSGALGLEALSRGARDVVFVDREPAVARHLAETLRRLGSEQGRVVRADALQYLGGAPTDTHRHETPGAPTAAAAPFDVIFLDPPFSEPVLAEVCRRIADGGWLSERGHVYLEAPAAAGLPTLPAGWTVTRSKRAGAVGYHLARRDPGAV